METVIALKHVKRRFGKQEVVAIEELYIERGQIYGLIGPNGAGKSTIMKMVCGLLQVSEGQIEIAGLPMIEKNRASLVKKIGCMIEEPAYYDNLSGLENLQILQRLKGLSPQDVDEVLAIVGLLEHKNKLVKHYSLGMKQRLGIAMAIMGRPEFVILDEPTNGLDPQAREEIRRLIRSLPERFQTTVMISSHALDEIEKMVTQIGIVGKGKLLYQGTVEQFKHRHGGRIFLRTSDNPLASALLDMGEVTENGLLLSYQPDEVVAQYLEKLMKAGIQIYRVNEQEKSLEELFLDFTKDSHL
ncbi:ABC transporter ATP-binding protein [Streptococcus gallolyticus]|nr:ABC transporter ATP-binding protein [Streptococcus gallolyticus]MBY5040121.1 ABC transporter ATP-binding protein [Streptococcus gallolyticus]